ncbi:HpcH/HpaI aldolase/citrate lyase family protein [Sphingobium vermicomposti]|uniref:Citrate lyase subunit beta/citryl-CoA lyase n=1 Tax=Sphingobium vermicomposti TaxID=529005 RepID=A0A846M9G8_9SPHN|nr:CoA ester lyase [Sphingobium vermicomposti]NIJ17888.1 citrate lyase subunit beta/citryl-CoA lyase [Sphingobium vermicomposti]
MARLPNPGWKSLLFVGADQPERIAKVATRGADAVILDLEDAVPAAGKAAARAALPDAINTLASQGQPLVIRINSAWRDVLADLDAALQPGVTALMVPGCERVDRLSVLWEMISELAAERQLDHTPGLIGLVESAAGLVNLPELVAFPQMIGLALGPEDLALDMGVSPSAELLDMPSRQMALAARAHDLMALAVPVSIAAYADADAYRAAALTGRSWGVTGAICIHPTQVAIANAIFQPSEQDLEEARSILEAWASRDGGGVVSLRGRMIDLPVVERARRLLDNR